MKHTYFLTSKRIAFSKWQETDFPLAKQLWQDSDVTKFIYADGPLTSQEVAERLETEMTSEKKHAVQYYPIFNLENDEFIGCCGFRPFSAEGGDDLEMGFHLRKKFWGAGFTYEAGSAVLEYARGKFPDKRIYAGHAPDNLASRKVLEKLGFVYFKDSFYPPTGRFHPSYYYKG
ncbi:hypothetical protein OfM1_14860 [Lactovum odontotermitis]